MLYPAGRGEGQPGEEHRARAPPGCRKRRERLRPVPCAEVDLERVALSRSTAISEREKGGRSARVY